MIQAILLYTSRYIAIHKKLIFRNKYVKLSRHAIIRARQRNITADVIQATINGGKVNLFGKNLVRFSKKYKNKFLVCIGEDLGQIILIKTIAWKK